MKNVAILLLLFFFVLILQSCNECDCPEAITNTEIIISDTNDLWQRTNGPYGDEFLDEDLSIDNDDRIYLFSKNSIYLSTDIGDSWQINDIKSFDGEIDYYDYTNYNYDFNVIFKENGLLFAGTVFKEPTVPYIKKSNDFGETWEKIDISSGVDSLLAEVRLIGKDSDGNIYAKLLIRYYSPTYAIVKSSDNGNTWTEVKVNGKMITNLSLSNKGKLLIHEDEDIYFISSNNGDTWNKIDQLEGKGLDFFLLLNNNEIIFKFDYPPYFLYRTSDFFQTFSLCVNGISGSRFENIVQSENGTLYCTCQNGLYRSTDNAENWEMIFSKSILYRILIARSGFLFVSQHNINVIEHAAYQYFRTKVPIE